MFTDTEKQCYYLFGTTDKNPWGDYAEGFDVYTSNDLNSWTGPLPAFRPDANFWADRHFWAPEVHKYNGKYYMLASFKSKERCRGVQILCAESPTGPFKRITNNAITPKDWECLDGTLYFDENEKPWLVFSHEWTQIHDGTMCCMRLNEDLTDATQQPITLFRASESGWSIMDTGPEVRLPGENYVTDGPFIVRNEENKLVMLWSSFSNTGYSIGIAYSDNGNIRGPWKHISTPFFSKDGGHGMLFTTLSGQLMLSIHQPNISSKERPRFIPVTFDKYNLKLIEE